MNIFILDYDVDLNVTYYNDIHLNKMLLETCQILCSVQYKYGGKNIPYKETHRNHPCVIWAGLNQGNYKYLLSLGYALEKERIYRNYNPSSKMVNVLDYCKNNLNNLPLGRLTSFVQVMPEKYYNSDTVQAYRNYYVGDKQGYLIKSSNKWKISTWTKRGKPDWFIIKNN